MSFIIVTKSKVFRYKSNKICIESVCERLQNVDRRNYNRSKKIYV